MRRPLVLYYICQSRVSSFTVAIRVLPMSPCASVMKQRYSAPSLSAVISTRRVGEVSPVRYSTNTFACPLIVLAESAIDCCAVNGLLIPHLPHKLFLSRNKVNLEIVRFLLLYRGVCSPSMQQHLTKYCRKDPFWILRVRKTLVNNRPGLSHSCLLYRESSSRREKSPSNCFLT